MYENLWIERDGEPVRARTPEEVREAQGLFADGDARIVWKTKRGDIEVSTVFLVLDHSHHGDGSALYETMSFGWHYEYQRRYATRREAIAGHKDILREMRIEDYPPPQPWEKPVEQDIDRMGLLFDVE